MRPLIVLFVSLSLILCLLSLTTNYWYENIENEYNSGLFLKCFKLSLNNSNKICQNLSYKHSYGLGISAFIFLLISFIILILSWIKSNNRLLAYLNALFLLISSLLIILTFILYPKEKTSHQIGHSTYLLLISSLLTFLSTILTIYVAQTIP